MSDAPAAIVSDTDPPTAKDEKEKMSLAPTFDRLVEANLKLTVSVGRLVLASYLVLGASLVSTIVHVVFR